jgi:catalase
VKIHLKTNQGVKNLTLADAVTLTGTDPDSSSRDLFDSIANGDYPSWTVYAQIIDPQAAENYTTNIFDATKTISQTDYPLIPFGKITLNQNPINFFSEVEQAAFNPAAIIPGWQVSPDPSKSPISPSAPPSSTNLLTTTNPVLQVRLFAYGDTQRYRLGVNFNQLPVNRPGYSYNPTKRDGANNIMNYGSLPNYIPAYNGPKIIPAAQYEQQAAHERWAGTVTDFESQLVDADFVQPRATWVTLGLTPGQQANFVGNVAASLSKAVKPVRSDAYGMLAPSI